MVPLKLVGNILEFVMAPGFYLLFHQVHKSSDFLTSVLEKGEQWGTNTARILVLKYQE